MDTSKAFPAVLAVTAEILNMRSLMDAFGRRPFALLRLFPGTAGMRSLPVSTPEIGRAAMSRAHDPGPSQSLIISVCIDCVYFFAYGRLDDQAMNADPAAGKEHAAKIAAEWGADAEITLGCGRDCPDHGIAAYADEDAYETALETRDSEPWFSWSQCEGCGSVLGGDREHATVHVSRKEAGK